MKDKIQIRLAQKKDAKDLLAIYKPYVENTPITFEYEVPSLLEFEQRIEKTLTYYPYLVAKIDQKIVGYAYASAYKQRAAYDWSVETSIYVDRDFQAKGAGFALYSKLEEILRKQNITNMYACIAFPNRESIEFHERFGFTRIGYFKQCGYKMGEWQDMIWMEKMIGEHKTMPQNVIPITQMQDLF